jgi:nucleoside-diphosphate-sugar epimerase
MIEGSGLIAQAFMQAGAQRLHDTCIYAAGVSNSGCRDSYEFMRERERFEAVLAACPADTRIVYFSTCSIGDTSLSATAYVQHKLRMEARVRRCPRHLILRLPQVAGRTPNPHTLLNFLHERMLRGEHFQVWAGAVRNIIDVADVARIALDLIAREQAQGETVNVANPFSNGMLEIVRAMERVLDTSAEFDLLDRTSGAQIDVGRIEAAIRRCGIRFGDAYLARVIERYYGEERGRTVAIPAAIPLRPSLFPSPAWQL